MAIVIRPIHEPFKLVFSEGEEKVEFLLKQLDYKTKSYISGLTTSVKQGQISVDSSLTCFYNIKFGVKGVIGLVDENGKAYELKFEDKDKKALTDQCTDELLAAVFSDNLIFAANALSKASFPEETARLQ